MFEQLMAIKRTMRSEDDGGSVDEKVSEGAEPSGSFQEKKASCPLSMNRSSDLCNEFENNGMHIVEMFRGTYPLRRFESSPGHVVTGAAADPGAKKTLVSSLRERVTFVGANTVPFASVHERCSARRRQKNVLTNQLRRHSMLRAVGGWVTQVSFAR